MIIIEQHEIVADQGVYTDQNTHQIFCICDTSLKAYSPLTYLLLLSKNTMYQQILCTKLYDESKMNYKMNGVLDHDSAFLRLYWARDNLG